MKPVNVGLTIPGIVANVFEMPIITLACWGAISNGLTLKHLIEYIIKNMNAFKSMANLRETTPGKCT